MRAPPRTELRHRIDAELEGFLSSVDLPPEARPLADELVALIRAGGKRLRPLFCYWGHLAGGGTDGPNILQAAAALELLHTFAIVHDDVMDRSPLRRGRPAAHHALARPGRDPSRFGESAAVLAGDLALVLADRMLRSAGFPAPRLAPALELYDEMRLHAVAGQYLDLRAAQEGWADLERARRVAVLKSGHYTVVYPLRIGAALAGAAAEVDAALTAYGTPLGEAFQLRDDVLGVFGDPGRTGKDRDGDLREGKQTVLLAETLARASPPQREVVLRAVGRPDLRAEEAEAVREVMRATGALDATLARIERLAAEAKAALGPPLPPPARAALEELADLVVTRDV